MWPFSKKEKKEEKKNLSLEEEAELKKQQYAHRLTADQGVKAAAKYGALSRERAKNYEVARQNGLSPPEAAAAAAKGGKRKSHKKKKRKSYKKKKSRKTRKMRRKTRKGKKKIKRRKHK
jgi:hypothetical protein